MKSRFRAVIGGSSVGLVTSVSVALVILELIEVPLPLVKLNGFTGVGVGLGLKLGLGGVATTATWPIRFTWRAIAEMP